MLKRNLYIGSAVINSIVAWFCFKSFHTGLSIIKGPDCFIGIMIWVCILAVVVSMNIVAYKQFKQFHVRKFPYFLTVALPFFVITLLRTLYTVLQSWG